MFDIIQCVVCAVYLLQNLHIFMFDIIVCVVCAMYLLQNFNSLHNNSHTLFLFSRFYSFPERMCVFTPKNSDSFPLQIANCKLQS